MKSSKMSTITTSNAFLWHLKQNDQTYTRLIKTETKKKHLTNEKLKTIQRISALCG